MSALILSALFALPAHGEDSMSIALNLGTVIAAEDMCGLSFDQAGIAAYIEAHVAADDMGFPASLDTMIGGARYSQEAMSQSARTAHCVQVARLAKSYGFTN